MTIDQKSISFLIQQNKADIRFLEQAIEGLRTMKRISDEQGRLDEEYYAHNGLKFARSKLKKYVEAQKQLKKLLKPAVPKVSKKHRKGEGE